jgi:hypothetical protein
MPPGTALASAARRKAWTPALFDASGVAVNLGTGATAHGEYFQVGDSVFYEFVVVFGTGVTFTNAGTFTVSLPVAPAVSPTGRFPTAMGVIPAGHGRMNDADAESGVGEFANWVLDWGVSLASSRLTGWIDRRATTDGTSSLLQSASPITIAVNDMINGIGHYPVSLTAL